MVDASVPRVPLGVANLVGEAFGLFFRRLHVVALIGFVPYFVFTLIQYSVIGVAGPVDPVTGEANWVGFAVTMLLGLGVFALVTSMLTEAAYDAKLGRPTRLAAYFLSGVKRLLPVLVLTIVAYIGVVLGMVALVVPGLWLAACLSVMVPAIVVEDAGFGGLSRSWRLTMEYRWPIVGFFLLITVIFIVMALVLGIVLGGVIALVFSAGFEGLADPTGLSAGMLVGLSFFNGLSNAISSGFLCIALALLYARLREVKEGISVEQIADVFA